MCVYCVRQVAFLAGCLYTAVGILKLGWLTNFLSHSVISGFMSGASVIIALSQVGSPLRLTSSHLYTLTCCSQHLPSSTKSNDLAV